MTQKPLVMALSRGRLLPAALTVLERIGIEPDADLTDNRKMLFDTNKDWLKLIVARSSDVPIYVEHGAADIGISGRDVLLEHPSDALCDLYSMEVGRCRLVLAAPPDRLHNLTPKWQVRIATKYPRCTEKFFISHNLQVEIIRLSGGMELAPLLDMADGIVDLTDTGRTLRANGLRVVSTIAAISARLIANRISLKVRHSLLQDMIRNLHDVVQEHESTATA